MALLADSVLATPLLEWLGTPTRVVVGEGSSPVEREAALRLCRALDPLAPSVRLITDAWALAHPSEASAVHLIVVGTTASNRVLRRHPSPWWRVGSDEVRAAFPVRGLYVFGAGDFESPRVGLVEPRRNPFAVCLHDATEPTPDTPLTWMITCTGGSPEGVDRAVRALLEERMISGVVLDPAEAPRSRGPFDADAEVLASMPPASAMRARVEGLRVLGWHQADGLLLGALQKRLGSRPRALWRIVLRDPAAPHTLRANLHRRNTRDEVLLVEMPKEAIGAARRLIRDVGEPREKQEGNVTFLEVRRADDTVYAAAAGRFWAIESLQTPHARGVLEAIIRGVAP